MAVWVDDDRYDNEGDERFSIRTSQELRVRSRVPA
jgi:hypothetical protein